VGIADPDLVDEPNREYFERSKRLRSIGIFQKFYLYKIIIAI
jgi:hypothetical protein